MPAKGTIVFVHGAHVNSRCWEKFIGFFESRGFACIAPDWPFDDRDVPALRARPAAELGGVGVSEIVEHFAGVVRALDEAPVLIGHSFGGLFVQLLLDRGLGAAGVAIDPAPPKGVLPNVRALKANAGPILALLRGQRTILMSERDFGSYFGNRIPERERKAAFERYVIPTPLRIFAQAAAAPFSATLKLRNRNGAHPPLLITAADHDEQVPLSLIRANFRRYSGSATTDFKVFQNHGHTLIFEPGWEEVAEYIYGWIDANEVGARSRT